MAPAESKEPRVKFVPEITLGHILTAGLILLTFVSSFMTYSLTTRSDIVELKSQLKALTENVQSLQGNEKEFIGETRGAIDIIKDKISDLRVQNGGAKAK
jgi:hypothetical protein